MKRRIELIEIDKPAYPCSHRRMTWGFAPGIVTCTCGGRWRARIVRRRRLFG